MRSRSIMQLDEAPGLYLTLASPSDEAPPHPDLERLGPCPSPWWLGWTGLHAAKFERDGWTIVFDGLLTDRPSVPEAQHVLETFRAGGARAVAELDGYFNALVFEPETGRVHVLSDVLVTRPWWVYRERGKFALAPTPLFFRDIGLPMTLDRQGAFETVRMLHTAGHRTAIAEVVRTRPSRCWTVEPTGDATEAFARPIAQEDPLVDSLDEHAEWVREIIAHTVGGVIDHPRLAARSIEMPLTGGLDSRAILAELLVRDRAPRKIRHIRLTQGEYASARAIADGLGLPFESPPIEELDYRSLLRRWATRSGGLLNAHQAYLLDMGERLGDDEVLGFDGHLMDWFLGVYPKERLPESGDPTERIWNRAYGPRPVLARLFPDIKEREAAGRASLQELARQIDGTPIFRQMMLDLHNRGVNYTGGAYPILSDQAQYFAPGGHRRTFEFIRRARWDVAGEKRARLRSMQQHFPELAAYPDPKGKSYFSYAQLRKKTSIPWERVPRFVLGLMTGAAIEPWPQSEHAWLRRIEPLVRVHERLVEDSLLVADGHISRSALRLCWTLEQRGWFMAWMLMSLLSVETSYRILVRGQSVADIEAWLFE